MAPVDKDLANVEAILELEAEIYSERGIIGARLVQKVFVLDAPVAEESMHLNALLLPVLYPFSSRPQRVQRQVDLLPQGHQMDMG